MTKGPAKPAAGKPLAGETPEQTKARLEREASMAEYLAWKAEKEGRAKKGREAIEGAEEWVPHGEGDGADKPKRRRKKAEGEDEGPPEGDPDKPKPYRPRRIPRYNGKGEMVWTGNTVPPDCPVTPLGVDGLTTHFLTPWGQLVSLGEGKFGLTHIKQLFGNQIPYAEKTWPKFNKQGIHTGFAAESVADALLIEAGRKGVFDLRDKVRGRGCWRGPNGELIQHLGDQVLIGGVSHKPGEITIPVKGVTDEVVTHVYPGRPKLPPPKPDGRKDCETIYAKLQTWQWTRGEIDARLLLGWMACIVLGSALDWRPMVFWMGDAGTGKSTLQKYVRELLYGRLIATVDASAASLRQTLQMDSLGVSFDELEADQKNDQARLVIKLARCAASGDKIYRGGSDHKAAEFMLQGCFGFSAIVPPPMGQADTQRFAFLRLKKQPKGAKTPKWKESELRQLGAGLVGRITEGWDQWQDRLDAYKAGLEAVGHEQRGQDQFGTLLAAADMLLSDGEPDPETISAWCDQLKRDGVAEYEQTETAWLEAFNRVLSGQPEAWRSAHFPTVQQVLSEYWWEAADKQKADRNKTLARLQAKLVRGGLAVVHGKGDDLLWLAIPPSGHAISAMFEDHNYKDGAWTNALRGADPWDPQARQGVWKADNVNALLRTKCTLYRLDATVDGRRIFVPDPPASCSPEETEDEAA